MTLIQEDAPHPLGYRPDLPLRSELGSRSRVEEAAHDEGYTEGYNEGHTEGRWEGREDADSELSSANRRLESEIEAAREELKRIKEKSA